MPVQTSCMESFTFGLGESLAKRLEQMSTGHGPGFIDHLLETHMTLLEQPTADSADGTDVTHWAPRIGLDAVNKSVEIDVGSQVIVVNLVDFYKPRDAAALFGASAAAAAAVSGNGGAASGLELLASTAHMYRSRQQHTCAICQTRCQSQVALRVHYGSAHGTQLHGCDHCGQSFIRKRDLQKHDCEQSDDAPPAPPAVTAAHKPRIPPLVVRPPKGHQPKRLEDTSSEDEDDPKLSAAPPAPAAPPRRMSAPSGRGSQGRPQPPNKKRLSEAAGKKEAYVCRVCQSKFRDPQSVLTHLKQYHPEHAMKAWKKFQDNLKSRRPEPAAASGAGSATRVSAGAAVGDGDTFAVRSVSGAPMKLKLSRSQQQQQQLAAAAAAAGGEQYAVLPSELPAVRPGQRQPIYHQTQYQVYQPEERTPTAPPSPPPTTGPPSAGTSPGYVTCAVCSGTKYYTYSDQCRLYGSYGCEACRKFVGRASTDQQLGCLLDAGSCHIPVLAPRNAADKRCRACWLKQCLLAFNLPEQLHDGLRQTLPAYMRSTVPRSAVKPYRECGVCERDNLE